MKKIYLIAAVIALVAGFATYFFAMELKTSKIVTGVNEATVVVALQDIKEDTVLTKEMFQEIKLPQTAVSFGTVSDLDDVIGYMAKDRILKGEQLMTGRITRVGDERAEGRLSYELANGMYAYTITVEAENSVGFFIKEKDIINIYNRAVPSAEPVLSNIKVIRVSDYVSNVQEDAGVAITAYTTITVALTKEQIAKIMAVESPRITLVPYVEGYSLVDDIVKASVPAEQNAEPQTNYGMGDITTAPPETQQ